MDKTAGRGEQPGGRAAGNLLLARLPQGAMAIIAPKLERLTLTRGDSLFNPGDAVQHVYFPQRSAVVAFILPMQDGRMVEAATIGREGAVGGVVSLGLAPAFARAQVQISGSAQRLPIECLEEAKRAVPRAHDILARYADCLTAQVLQSVACAALHSIEARCARWLLMTSDRLQQADLPLTQEALAETLGVTRTYVTRIASDLQERGAIRYRRGIIRILQRSLLEASACECYHSIRHHFERVLPGLYPTAEL